MPMLPENSVRASARASIVVIAFVIAITIGAESSVALKDWIASLTGHHWVTKSVASVAVYLLSFAFFSRGRAPVRADEAGRSLKLLTACAFAGAAVLLGYFTWHFIYA